MSMEDNDYRCPECKGYLNSGGHIVFATKTRKNHTGLLMLDTTVGDYIYKHHAKFHLEEGEMVDF